MYNTTYKRRYSFIKFVILVNIMVISIIAEVLENLTFYCWNGG